MIVAIRTLLSFALELEVSGRWPWQRAQAAGPEVQALITGSNLPEDPISLSTFLHHASRDATAFTLET